MNNKLDKKDFVDAINEVRNTNKYHEELNSFLSKHGVEGYIFQPDCVDVTLRLLHIIFGKADRDNWIEYFCFDLNFGKKWEPGFVTQKDGTDIKLETPEDLYDYLVSMD